MAGRALRRSNRHWRAVARFAMFAAKASPISCAVRAVVQVVISAQAPAYLLLAVSLALAMDARCPCLLLVFCFGQLASPAESSPAAEGLLSMMKS